MPTPQIWSHTTHIFTTQDTFTCYKVMGCGEGTLNPMSNFTLQKVLVICYFTGRCAGSLSKALFLCVIKRRHPLLTSRSVGDRRVNWYRQLVEWHFGHHKSHTHQSRLDPTFCIHCSFMLCCSTALYKNMEHLTCVFAGLQHSCCTIPTLREFREPSSSVSVCDSEFLWLLVLPLQEVPDVLRTKLLVQWL